ncbi:hypothetical protein ACI2KT_28230 [Ensifer adhaerens]|uniref:hypothetical protein n=1 Tax=Ensifer TaxID=106591 RepID=UPI001782F201|nr:hypothetical protein [Ensifer sp. ENS08]MBD9572759.1 hypothetical protein [Ensifer sp. ENS08]
MHALISIGIGFLVCVALSRGYQEHVPELNLLIAPIISFSTSVSDRFPNPFTIIEWGSQKLIPIEALCFIASFMVLFLSLLTPLIIASLIVFFPTVMLSVIAAALSGRRNLAIFAPVALFFSLLLAIAPFEARHLLRKIGEDITNMALNLVLNPMLVLGALAFGAWRAVSLARSSTRDVNPVTEGAKDAWEFATGTVADDAVNTLQAAATDAFRSPPSRRHLGILGLFLGLATAADSFLRLDDNEREIFKHVFLLVITLFIELFIVIELASFIVHSRRKRTEAQTKTES